MSFLRHFVGLLVASFLAGSLWAAPALPQAEKIAPRVALPQPPAQETGFLNRKFVYRGVTYRFQVYLPEDWRRDDHKLWPIILFLHGRGERGSEGMWQTQIGLPAQVRDHPERWPFIIVMPQCPIASYWTDPEIQGMALAALERESLEFHGDPERTYLTGLSLGGYGAWELARSHPHRWAAIVIASSGIFWSYMPDRWLQAATLPQEYAAAVGKTSVWLFHGTEDNVVSPRQDELLYDALKASGGRVRLWLYEGLKHDSWSRAFNEPELPRWILAHRLLPASGAAARKLPPPFSERLVIPPHPQPIKLSVALLDSIAGEYRDSHGRVVATVFRQGDQLYERDPHGELTELDAESASSFFYPYGTYFTRVLVERDAQGRVVALRLRDDRHEERWEKHAPSAPR